jgi:acetyl-CoA carboxylase biotin carboxylase subunit
LASLKRALDDIAIEGVETTVGLHRLIVNNARFQAGAVDTRFYEEINHG